jgi:photosystem II Psb28-2 protein
MADTTPSIEFFVGLSEELSNVGIKHNKSTGVFSVMFMFEKLKALEKFQSFTTQTYGDLRLTDEEGTISVTPSGLKVIFGGDDGDDLVRVDCSFDIQDAEHWERFMRFMNRYAEANGMEFTKK